MPNFHLKCHPKKHQQQQQQIKKQRGKWKYYTAVNLLYSLAVSSAWQLAQLLRILGETCRLWRGSAGTLAKLDFFTEFRLV